MVDFKKLESLAKIKLADGERTAAEEYFSSCIAKFDRLADIDTAGIEPLVTPFALENIMREDAAFKMISRDELLEGAPEQQDGYFVVPRILE